MRRCPDVIDCWYDSGAMPFAQWHYPFENADWFETHHPADFICEAIDQTRGWFFTLLAESTLLFDKPCYRNVICLSHVVDKRGKKMSKSRGNIINPFELFDEFGADATRWYFYASVSAGTKLSAKGGRLTQNQWVAMNAAPQIAPKAALDARRHGGFRQQFGRNAHAQGIVRHHQDIRPFGHDDVGGPLAGYRRFVRSVRACLRRARPGFQVPLSGLE